MNLIEATNYYLGMELVENVDAVYKYSSTQFQVPDDIASKVVEFGETIPDDKIYTDPEDSSYGRENDIHCTVLYGIHDETSDNTKSIISKCKPFSVKLGKISYFNTDSYKVMKIEVVSDGVKALNKKLTLGLEYTNKFPDYNPHITIAYVSPNFDESSIDPDTFTDEEFDIDSIVFSSKDKKIGRDTLRMGK